MLYLFILTSYQNITMYELEIQVHSHFHVHLLTIENNEYKEDFNFTIIMKKFIET